MEEEERRSKVQAGKDAVRHCHWLLFVTLPSPSKLLAFQKKKKTKKKTNKSVKDSLTASDEHSLPTDSMTTDISINVSLLNRTQKYN